MLEGSSRAHGSNLEDRQPPPGRDGRAVTTRSTGAPVDDSRLRSARRAQTASIRVDVRAQHRRLPHTHPTSRPSRLSASRVARLLLQVVRRDLRAGQVRTTVTSTGSDPAAWTADLLQPRQRVPGRTAPGTRPGPRRSQQWFHGKRATDQRGRAPIRPPRRDAGVHVERGAAPRGPFARGLGCVGTGGTARATTSAAERGVAGVRHPDLPAVHRYDGQDASVTARVRADSKVPLISADRCTETISVAPVCHPHSS